MLVLLLSLLGVLALVIMACGSSANSGTSVGSSTSTGQKNSGSTGGAKHFKVGDQVKVGDIYIVTVNSFKRGTGSEVIIDITFKNVSSEDQDLSTALQCDLKDSTGQKLDQDIFADNTHAPDGTLTAGDTVRGQIAYKASTTEHNFTFTFEADAFSSGQTLWDLKV